ncbi:MAG TPA: stage II sporulation protein D [Clostridia bacterium]|nr:stage II sporulation protein D [Clostridia bacterium]
MRHWIDILLFIIVIVLILPSMVVGLFSTTDPDEPPPDFQVRSSGDSIRVESNNVNYQEPTITLYNHYTKALEDMPLEEYVVGVVAAEMPSSFEIEALKAQAVAARTLAARKLRSYGGSGCSKHKGADVCSEFIHCQAWIPESQQRKNWGDNYEENILKIRRAIEETRGYIMTYMAKPIEVFFYSTSNGKTEDVAEVFSASLPYYQVVDSPGEEDAPRYRGSVSLTNKEFVRIFNSKYTKSGLSSSNLEQKIKIVSRTDSGRVRDLKVGDTKVKATEFRTLYGLNSTDFDFRFEGDKVHIETTGYGHGVGMSQIGANAMARQGYNYSDILGHYYRGIKIETI